jgi:hypothetical protein
MIIVTIITILSLYNKIIIMLYYINVYILWFTLRSRTYNGKLRNSLMPREKVSFP